jgi:hypothetical protein
MLVAIDVIDPYNVYVDESIQWENPNGTGRRLYAVTAYLATFDRWVELQTRWSEILDNFDSPPFHFTDFMGRKEDFLNLDWSDDKRNRFMELLCATAAEHTVAGAGCAVFEDDYDQALPDDLRALWKDPYYFCIYGMLSLVEGMERQTRISPPRPLYFLFEEKQKFAGAALRMFTEFKEILEKTNSPNASLFGSAAFGPKKKFVPLQAADLLVGVINKRFREMVFNLPYKMEKPLDRLNRKGNLLISLPDKQKLEEYVQFLRDGKGIDVPHDHKRKPGT